MKKITKTFSFILTILMIFTSLAAVSANAAGTDIKYDASQNVAFTLASDKEGYEYAVYKIADISVSSTEPMVIKYVSKINDIGIKDAIYNGYSAAESNSTSSSALLARLDAIETLTGAESIGTYNTTTDGTSKSFTDLSHGIYYVRATAFPSNVASVTNSVFALPYYNGTDWKYALDGNIAVGAKTTQSTPEIEKTIAGAKHTPAGTTTPVNDTFTDNYANAGLGDTISFKIESSVVGSYSPSTANDLRLRNYVITDTMASGLTFTSNTDSIKLVDANGSTVKTLTRGTDYTMGTSNQSMTFTLSSALLADSIFYTASKVVLTYDAVLNENAVIATSDNTNEAKFSFTNKSGVESEIEDDDKAYVYTFGIELTKQDDRGNALAGSTFKLYETEADASAQTNEIATGISGDNGKVEFKVDGKTTRLSSGNYYIVETEATSAYSRYTAVIPVELEVAYYDAFTANTWIHGYPADGILRLTVQNSKLITPNTGAEGNSTVPVIIGLSLLLVLASLIALKIKVSKKDN